MPQTQVLSSGLIIRQDFAEVVRPVFFQTEYEEFPYATHGGTLFPVVFRGRVYGVTCTHVFGDFPHGFRVCLRHRFWLVHVRLFTERNSPGKVCRP
jgi:hypothetical protein